MQMCAGSRRLEDYIQALNCQLHCLKQHYHRKLGFVGENQKEKRKENSTKEMQINEPMESNPV